MKKLCLQLYPVPKSWQSHPSFGHELPLPYGAAAQAGAAQQALTDAEQYVQALLALAELDARPAPQLPFPLAPPLPPIERCVCLLGSALLFMLARQ